MSRGSVVTLLVAAEVGIVLMAIAIVGRHASFASGMHQAQFTAAPIAPIAVGARPHVVIDDPDSRVVAGVSNDGFVHVRDLTQMRGVILSNGPYPHLAVTRTSDGVRIDRPHAGRFSVEIFGFSEQRIEVDVPQDARLEIARCSGADVADVTGGVSVHSADGHVTLTGLQGSVEAQSDDGYVSATDVRGDRLALASADGHLSLDDVAVQSLSGTTRDGRITAKRLSVGSDATLKTDDGSVHVSLVPNSNLTIDASTRDGSIAVDGSSLDDSTAQRTIRVGAGTGRMQVSTADGSIHIFTNGETAP